MKETPIFAIITDLHISDDNWEEVVECSKEAIDKCVGLKIDQLFLAGDIFTSRKGQTQPTLFAFALILEHAREKKIHITAIAGNHDKMSYTSESSYLDTFAPYKGFELVKTCGVTEIAGKSVAMIPFFKESDGTFETYLKRLEKGIKKSGWDGTDYLITHIAVDGVKNNDGSEVDGAFTKDRFKKFSKVFIGHYHNKQQVGDNIFYIGSLRQNNFGEDLDKGMTVVFDNGEHDQYPLNSTSYRTVTIDLNKVKPEQIDRLDAFVKGDNERVRLKIKGTKEQIAKVNRVQYKMQGYSIDVDVYDPEVNVDYADIKDFRGFDKEEILVQWDNFSGENTLSKEDDKYCKEKLTEILK
jgi:DNA repair exonuclease SbcCD nuclease subunit